jgi:hypothetical protein
MDQNLPWLWNTPEGRDLLSRGSGIPQMPVVSVVSGTQHMMCQYKNNF